MNECELKEYIKKHFHYDNGIIRRDDRKGSGGSLDKDGYLVIKVKGKQFKAHRIAWLLCYGDFPKSEIDHINRDRLDNRIENLRESTRKEQARNTTRTPNKDTGVVGVYLDKSTKGLKKRFTTRFNKKTYRFYSLEDAINFRKKVGLWI